MSYFLKYLSTAPVLLTVWLSITSGFIMFINFKKWFIITNKPFLKIKY